MKAIQTKYFGQTNHKPARLQTKYNGVIKWYNRHDPRIEELEDKGVGILTAAAELRWIDIEQGSSKYKLVHGQVGMHLVSVPYC